MPNSANSKISNEYKFVLSKTILYPKKQFQHVFNLLSKIFSNFKKVIELLTQVIISLRRSMKKWLDIS